ncbi:SDR family NAD(P)-dependent oxidoreductase [Kitasatospora sp. NPDC059571]|uniref:SDR family NAD(P)-dependent oxidoreductase n=1 Tax=Kitasatospora sp. NPDC059571 TaxID=3346871 RepID=UPI0036819E57
MGDDAPQWAGPADPFAASTAVPAGAHAPRPLRRPEPGRPVALVTGASSGIGAATAARLAAAGWHLLLSGTDAGRLDEVAGRTGGRVLAEDLSLPEGPQRLADRARAATGRVDALVASAGLGWRGPFAETPPDVLDLMVDVNLAAPLRLIRQLLPGMLERRHGRIVLIGSMAGQVGVRDEAAYAATKAGLAMFAESLWYELRGTGVGVRIVLPGAVDTPFFARRGSPYQRGRPRPVSPERVAESVVSTITTNCDRLFVPQWLGMPARIHGAVPGVFRRLASRFG